MNTRVQHGLRFLLAVVALAGCSNDFTSATLVDHARVLGARIEVVGDSTRSNPAPLESADVSWLITYPAQPEPLSWAFIVCVPEPTSFGEPSCAANIGAPTIQLEPALAVPTLHIDVPDEATLGDASQLLVLGSICANGQVNVDVEARAACADPEDYGTLVVLQVPIDRDGMANQNPAFDGVMLDGAALDYVAPSDAAATGCAGGDAPTITWREDVAPAELSAVDGSRETYSELRGVPPEPTPRTEDLQVENLTTAGEMDQHFAFFDDRNPTLSLEWTLPLLEEVAADGTLARFTFTMRDGRGGFAFTQRAVCVVAP